MTDQSFPTTNRRQAYVFLLKVAAPVVLLDQATKALVRATLDLEQTWTPFTWMEPYARIVHWKNTGASFGFLEDSNTLLILVGLAAAGAILYAFPRLPAHDWSLRLALALLMGGVSGNLIDRLLLGHVTDFLSIFSYNVFNLADVSNWAGVLVLLLGILAEEWRKLASRNAAR
ncbi:MAG: signal peptidase II [Anaerolineales bacterium]|nr:signal peptidase II [Anaerolineales bacterium]